jgi:hypothetical protein
MIQAKTENKVFQKENTVVHFLTTGLSQQKQPARKLILAPPEVLRSER